MTGRCVWLTAPAAPLDRMICGELLADPTIARVVCVYGAKATLDPNPPDGVQCVRSDFSSYRSLRDVIASAALRDIDTIVHTLSDVASAEMTRQLLHLAEEQRSVRRFILRSFADLYRLDSREPAFIDEHHALELQHVPAARRAYAEADFSVCERLGSSHLQVVVLRCAELLAPDTPGALHDYLSSRVCLRPLGYDPMLNVLSAADLARAIRCATTRSAVGVFNIPGRDTLPLSELIHATRRVGLSMPGPALKPLYALRTLLTKRGFHYPSEQVRFHYGAVLDGSRARELLGYEPAIAVQFERLFAGLPARNARKTSA